MQTLECRRFTRSEAESLLEESCRIWSQEIEFNSWSPIPRFVPTIYTQNINANKNLILDYNDQAMKDAF